MQQYNAQYAKALVEKSRTYGPETDEMTEQLEAAIEVIEKLQTKLEQADGMVQSMMNYQRFLAGGIH